MFLPVNPMPEWEAKTAADFALVGIQIWKVHLVDWMGWDEEFFGWLSDEEKKRARRMRVESLRRRFSIAHGVVREILGGYLHQPPADIEFEITPSGKPILGGRSANLNPMLQFNFSHSDELLLLAVCQGYELGIDVELMSKEIEHGAISRHFFALDEISWLQSLAPEHQAEAFYRLWTCKEAVLKADGSGLRQSLEAMKIVPETGQKTQPGWQASGRSGSKTWDIQVFQPAPEYTAALAINQEASAAFLPEIRYFNWTG